MSDTEYEKFEVSFQDLENEFNPNRGRRKITKNQQIYGIWADDDSDAEETTKSSRNSRRGGERSDQRTRKDYSAPIGFVAGGIQQAGLKKEKEEPKGSDEEESPERLETGSNTSSESEIDEKPSMSGMAGMAGFRMSSATSNTAFNQKGMADWEQHTKGIGAKLLLQMGYQPGKGLGKDLQGIAQPVQAHLRKGRGAIGAYGPEKKQTIGDGKAGASPTLDEDEKETKVFQEKMNHWRKDVPKTGKNQKNRYYYKSVQDVIEKGSRHKDQKAIYDRFNNQLSNVTVIDMTGPEKRVLSGYHALGQQKTADETLYEHRLSKKCTNFGLPELIHNLNLIVDMCEQDIITVDKKQRSIADQEKELRHEKENLTKIVDLEQNHLTTIDKAMQLVTQLTEPIIPLTLERAAEIFSELQTEFAPEYKEFGLGDLAPGVVAPLFNARLDGWNPLEEPKKHIELLKEWRRILGVHQETSNVFDPYAILVWSGVMPNMRAAVNGWNPRVHQPMAALLDAWAPILPNFTLDNVLEQLILPRINTCVIDWDPLTDTIPIHMWILPWTGLIGHKMEETIYPTIRDKLGSALTAWLPQDRSARAMIEPWRDVFAAGDMQCFLMQHIMPKLQMSLNELIINPLNQELECWNQVWEWNEIVPPFLMAQLLEKYFFPKWMQTLVIWLNQSPNLDQVSRWYSGWKNLLSKSVLQQTGIAENFRRALELMHRSSGLAGSQSGNSLPSADTSPLPPSQPPALMDLQIVAPPQLQFKELVSQKCAERGIIFAPMPGRHQAGKQVYRVGKLFCYIDRSVVMLSDGSFSKWQPVSVQTLLERAIVGTVY